MYELLEATSHERVDKIFEELKASNESNINGNSKFLYILFYIIYI